MANRPAFRYVNETVGAFVLLALVVIVIVAVQAGRVHRWFVARQTFLVGLPEEGSRGLRSGAEVLVLGVNAGRVIDIDIDSEGRMRATVRIQADFARFVREDSEVTIHRKFGVAGDAFLEITKGTGAPVPNDRMVLAAVGDTGATEALNVIANELREGIIPLIAELRAAAGSWTALADSLVKPDQDFPELIANLNDLSDRLQRGEGVLGRLLQDDALAENVAAAVVDARVIADDVKTISGAVREEVKDVPGLVAKLQGTLDELRAVLADVQQATDDLPRIASGMAEASDDLPALVMQAQLTLIELDRLAEAMQRSWLLGGSRDDAADRDRVAPQRVMP